MRFLTVSGLLLALTTVTAEAALYDRGNGMIYDDVLNITWLQDANYARTSGYDDDGAMGWNEANTWASQLVYGGYDDWRLASARLQSPPIIPGSWGIPDDVPEYLGGSWDIGYNIVRSELGHMFYNNLGNLADYGYFTPNAAAEGYETDPALTGLTGTSFIDATDGDMVSFTNVVPGYYWDIEPSPGKSGSGGLFAWYYFDFATGYQGDAGWEYVGPYYSWAVRDGDVSAVPVPAAAWLLGSALMALFGLGRARR